MKKVSIIIATYNRAQYIIETLKSIQNQSYQFWECLIIDDGSTDNTEELVLHFLINDDRFLFYKRPENLGKGANVCRNYGYRLSNGEYLKFFDSDDIMLPNHLEVLIDEIERNKLDFAVGDCRNFDQHGLRERPYEIDRKTAELSAFNFALHQVAWITNDLLVKRKLAEKIQFNEEIRDVANEYQYNIKLLLLTTKGILVDQILTHRRIHSSSMTSYLHRDSIQFDLHVYELKLATLKYVEGLAPLHLKKWFLSGFVQYGFNLTLKKVWPGQVLESFFPLTRAFSFIKGLCYGLALTLGLFLGKGYSIISWIRK